MFSCKSDRRKYRLNKNQVPLDHLPALSDIGSKTRSDSSDNDARIEPEVRVVDGGTLEGDRCQSRNTSCTANRVDVSDMRSELMKILAPEIRSELMKILAGDKTDLNAEMKSTTTSKPEANDASILDKSANDDYEVPDTGIVIVKSASDDYEVPNSGITIDKSANDDYEVPDSGITIDKSASDDYEVPENGIAITKSANDDYKVPVTGISIVGGKTAVPCKTSACGDAGCLFRSSVDKNDLDMTGYDTLKWFEMSACYQSEDDPNFNIYECIDDCQISFEV